MPFKAAVHSYFALGEAPRKTTFRVKRSSGNWSTQNSSLCVRSSELICGMKATSSSPSLSRPQSSSDFSVNSENNGSRKKGKKKSSSLPPRSLDEVFNMVSDVTSSNINPPPARMVLTPRSAEICLKLGVNPEVLKIRDIDSFWEPGIDPAVQRIRHEAYVQRRYDLMRQCRLERKRLAVAEFESATNLTAADTLTPEMVLKQQEEQNSTLIQMELQRIEKMRKRQQKELESMINFELNRAKLTQDMEKRIAEAKKKDTLRKKQQEKRMRLMAEERRLRELQKSAMEEAEEQQRLALAREAHEKERALAEEAARKQAEQRRRAREEEQERKRKHEEHRRQVEQFFAEEQMRLRQRLESMQYAERKKQEAIMKKQAEHAEMMRRKRQMIEERISMNMEMAKAIEEKKKQDFLSKQEQFEQIRAEHIRRQEEERELKAQELELQEQRRQMILLQQKREEERKAELMLEKFDEEEAHVMEVQERRNKDMTIAKERKLLKTQLKLENVHRVMRINDYRRLTTQKRIEENDQYVFLLYYIFLLLDLLRTFCLFDYNRRISQMLEQRQALVEERRRAAIATKRQKESISQVMEEVRTNATKANQIITKVLTGKLSLDQLASQGLGGSMKRSKSAGKSHRQRSSRSSSGEGSPISGDKLGLSRKTKSAGDLGGSPDGGQGESSEQLKYSLKSLPSVTPQTYISPYALPTGQV